MIIDHRTYSFRPGTVQKWLEKYEKDGLPIQQKYLGQFIGIFTTEVGNLHQVVFMWAYESLADRERRRANMESDPDWEAFISEIWELDAIVEQKIKMLRPASYSPLR
ncbi:MAG: NIPSNAP family protein [Gammaproteobacteria bacterium]|nr:NIPSNAP family protein [Gammaproteobacteria bacterium]MXW49143.1 NIPSNAP family protein [Gammaproteobacteria bacterium]MXY05230.1 NIPSNAP family protein [Gammaproteobacteria bacterium]MYE51536.1 NIPSNAP family protein [Gammaproteobacteria bacterium]MYG14292.1 NIPSNAP family protein [Gammaproteobacteria bacterium]